MPQMLVLQGIIFSLVTVLLAIAIGSNLFSVMVDEQIRYLQLIVTYAPLPATGFRRTPPDPVTRYLKWAVGNEDDPAGCARIRYSGKIRLGKDGRWMKMGGSACFSQAVPGFVWHSTMIFAPFIWIETLDYYVHRNAGMNLNLFSFFPLNNSRDERIAVPSLFRYLACAPLYPRILASPDHVSWEAIDDSEAQAVIHDAGIATEAIVRFNRNGWIDSIAAHDPASPASGHPIPGVVTCRFSDYAEIGGHHIPTQVSSEQFLPDGTYSCMEFEVISAEYDMPGKNREESN
jgi:hypothetical protein